MGRLRYRGIDRVQEDVDIRQEHHRPSRSLRMISWSSNSSASCKALSRLAPALIPRCRGCTQYGLRPGSAWRANAWRSASFKTSLNVFCCRLAVASSRTSTSGSIVIVVRRCLTSYLVVTRGLVVSRPLGNLAEKQPVGGPRCRGHLEGFHAGHNAGFKARERLFPPSKPSTNVEPHFPAAMAY